MRIQLLSPAGEIHRNGTGIFKTSLRYAPLTLTTQARLFGDLPNEQSVWMSHGDAVSEAPPGFTVTATSTGAPVIQEHRDVCVGISVPAAPAPAGGYPVLIFAHGTGGSFAEQFAKTGFAQAFRQKRRGFVLILNYQNSRATYVSFVVHRTMRQIGVAMAGRRLAARR